MKPGGGGPTAAPEAEPGDVPLVLPQPWTCPADVRLCGHLRKQKSQHRRFFVLRADPPSLECYKSEKKFRAGRAPPQLSVSLAGACTISTRVDARRRHLIVLYTCDRSLVVATACEAEQQARYSALLEVRAGAGPSFQEDPRAWILAPFQDVWPVTLRPKGLGRTRGLGSGRYRLCLGSGVLSLLRKPKGRGSGSTQTSQPPALRLSLLSVRRCGHADSFFFLELGRSAPTGPGELWLQAPHAVVAQSIHETVLAAMKRLGDDGAAGRAEALPRDPLMSAYRRSVSQPYATPASAAQSGGLSLRGGMGERSQKATPETLATLAASHPRELEQGRGYIAMGARSDYEPMGGGEAGGYMVKVSPGLAASAHTPPHEQLWGCRDTEYVPMSHFLPGSFSSSSLPGPYKPGPGRPGPSFRELPHGVGECWGLAGAHPCLQPPSELAGENVCIKYVAQDYLGMGTAIQDLANSRLNYIDLDLVPPLEAQGDALGSSTHHPYSYACIKFQNLKEVPLRHGQPDPV